MVEPYQILENTRKEYIFNVNCQMMQGKGYTRKFSRRFWKSFWFLSERNSYLEFYIERNVIQSHICIQKVPILYKTDTLIMPNDSLIMTHKHVCNIIISGIDTMLITILNGLKSLFMFMLTNKSRTKGQRSHRITLIFWLHWCMLW